VPIYITMQFTKGICLLYIVANPLTTNILAMELIAEEKYMPSIVTMTKYYMRTLDKQALDLKN